MPGCMYTSHINGSRPSLIVVLYLAVSLSLFDSYANFGFAHHLFTCVILLKKSSSHADA
jgi:hypothetical protein